MKQLQHSSNTDDRISENSPAMYWGVSSGGSLTALENACTDETYEHHGYTIDAAEFPAPQNLEISFATQNNHRMWEGPNWFVDCGGYTELNRAADGKYNTSIKDYIEYLVNNVERGINIEYWALRDWPVETALLREHDRSQRDHQRWTVRDHHKCLDLATERGLLDSDAEPMAVIQGEDVDGYLWMLDHLRDQGLLTDHVCIGSIKDLKTHEAISVAEKVRETLPSKYTLHGLGITGSDLQNAGIVEYFDTVDTQAWNKRRSNIPKRYDDVRNTWIGYLYAYDLYRQDIRTNTFKTSQQGTGTQLTDFGSVEQTTRTHGNPLRLCVCGSILDRNAIIDHYDNTIDFTLSNLTDAIDTGGCRHCRRSAINLADRAMVDR